MTYAGAHSPMATSRGWQLISRPHGEPRPTDFALVESELEPLLDGQIRVRNEFLSVDPYMRGRMNDVRSYVAPFRLDEVMTGGAVGTVVASAAEDLPVGTMVTHEYGWRDVAQGPARHFRTVTTPAGLSPSVHLGALGLTGLTAWVGLLQVARMQPGEVVFISGAAGAVGSIAGQLARLRRAGRVIGSAGTDAKVDLLVERYGFDAAFNYRAAPVKRQLHQIAPDGIDVYFDNVGGDHLEAAINSFRDFGRAALCGAIAAYNSTEPPAAPRNLAAIIGKNASLNGFLATHYRQHAAAAYSEIGGALVEGALVQDETVMVGLELAPAAFIDMLAGTNTGKMVVALAGREENR